MVPQISLPDCLLESTEHPNHDETNELNDSRNAEDPLENWDSWCFRVKLVPLDAKKLTADVPQPPRRLLASSLWGYKGGGAVAEMKAEGIIIA